MVFNAFQSMDASLYVNVCHSVKYLRSRFSMHI